MLISMVFIFQKTQLKHADEDDETKSETGSVVESVHSEVEDDHSQSGSESDMESVHTD